MNEFLDVLNRYKSNKGMFNATMTHLPFQLPKHSKVHDRNQMYFIFKLPKHSDLHDMITISLTMIYVLIKMWICESFHFLYKYMSCGFAC